MVRAIENCRSEGATVVCATHDPALIRTLGAREIRLGRHWNEVNCFLRQKRSGVGVGIGIVKSRVDRGLRPALRAAARLQHESGSTAFAMRKSARLQHEKWHSTAASRPEIFWALRRIFF